MKKTETLHILLLLSLLSAFPPLSTDMYLPAIPLLTKEWHQPLATVNLTLVGFFIGYCIGLLVYGPLSDRFGRRPPLLVGIGVYIVASLLCAVADNVISLIVFRVLQAAGAASASALALAISKDLFDGNERQRILAYIGVIMALAPMLAPIFGGWMMTWFSWPWIFFAQAAIGAVAWAGVFRMEESLKSPATISVSQTSRMYLQLLQNRRYIGFVLLFTCIVFPHFAFIGSAADIYISRFGMSEQLFSYFFAFNALAIMAGAFACTRLQRKLATRQLLTMSFAGILISGLVMLSHIFPGPWGLALPMAVASFSFGLSRPPCNHTILNQVEHNAGAASSFMVFIHFMAGAFSMWLIALEWADKIRIIGILGVASGGIVLTIWLLLSRLQQDDRTVRGLHEER